MPTIDWRSNAELRINSGFAAIKIDADWEILSKVESFKLRRKSGKVSGKYADGMEWSKKASTASGVDSVFTQCSKQVLDRLDALDGKIVEFALYNGLGDDGNYQVFYAPEAEMIVDVDIDMKGDSAQLIPVSFEFQPQVDLPAVTPSTGLPPEMHLVGAVEVEGVNPFYVIVEEAAEA